jgi:hypothetical protein
LNWEIAACAEHRKQYSTAVAPVDCIFASCNGHRTQPLNGGISGGGEDGVSGVGVEGNS